MKIERDVQTGSSNNENICGRQTEVAYRNAEGTDPDIPEKYSWKGHAEGGFEWVQE